MHVIKKKCCTRVCYGSVKETMFDSIDYTLPIRSTQCTGIIRLILRNLYEKSWEIGIRLRKLILHLYKEVTQSDTPCSNFCSTQSIMSPRLHLLKERELIGKSYANFYAI